MNSLESVITNSVRQGVNEIIDIIITNIEVHEPTIEELIVLLKNYRENKNEAK